MARIGTIFSGLNFPDLPFSGFAGKDGDRKSYGDILFAAAILGILALLILPAPSWLLDILLAISISFSVMVLMTALFTRRALDFSTFPAILLVATMLRLGLNIASTRLILSEGSQGPDAAGHIIQAFGNFVMQGNTIIGMIVFAILVIVNFVVITRGSGRIAEVAARFSLDAMPGKQMAIDADLSAGLINETQARERRKTLEDESNFFGAMDGASKFVRGDAIAGLLITLINLVAGVIIGVMQMNMSIGDAGQSYSLLTIGDGLVSQIPALIISVAAGLLVSKAGVDGAANQAISQQFTEYPRALGLLACVMFIFSLMPGMPSLVFIALAAIAGFGAFQLSKMKPAVDPETLDDGEATPPAEDQPATLLAMDDLRVEIGFGLLSLVNSPDGPRLTDQIKALRRSIAHDLGFITPPIRVLDNLQLDANRYVIRLKEQEIASGSVKPGAFLAMEPSGKPIDLPGEPTREPAFGLDAMWIDDAHRDSAALRGLTVVDAATVLTTHLTEMIKAEAPNLLSYAETRKLLDDLPEKHQSLVNDLIPAVTTVTTVQRVLQRLLSEQVSIRDLPSILESIAEAAPQSTQIEFLTEHVRARLGRQICARLADHNGQTPILMLSATWEEEFHNAISGEGAQGQLTLAPSRVQSFVNECLTRLEQTAADGASAAIVTSARIRPYVRSILERVRTRTVVLSQSEIHPQSRLRNLGQI